MLATVPSFAATLAELDEVGGWLSDDQALRLWTRALEVESGGRIVEIGSFQGRSTIVLASAAHDDVTVVAIDPHAGNDRGPQELSGYEAEAEGDHELFHANLSRAGVKDRVQHVRRFSSDAHADVPGAIELLFIDGAHRYAPALADLREWGERVVPGGTMLVHDSFSSIGVTLALLRSMLLRPGWRYVGRSRSLAEYRREPVHGRQRAGSAALQLAQLGWFAKNVVFKVLIAAKLKRGPWPY
jgi:predicted O-methyltransferase YrrM